VEELICLMNKTLVQQDWKGLQPFSEQWLCASVFDSSASHLLLQQLSSVSVFNENKSTPGFIAKNKIAVANNKDKNFMSHKDNQKI